MELIILCGIQGAGKSTFFQARFAETHSRINLDALRSRDAEWDEFSVMITNSKPIVIDNTNQSATDRAKYIEVVKPLGYRIVGFQFEVPLAVAINRVKRRTTQKPVPEFVIRNTQKKIVPLSKSEGFDQIYVVSECGDIINSTNK